MAEETFECGICACDFELKDRIWAFPDDPEEGPICEQCVEESFKNAYRQTSDPSLGWGVSWGNKHLRARDHISILGEAFVAKYERLEAEYKVLKKDRVYCPHPASDQETIATCDAFVGAAKSGDGNNQDQCPKCSGKVCLNCREVSTGDDHQCPGPSDVKKEENHLPSGWVRGTDFQQCPECDHKFAHGDQCNWVQCPIDNCRTGFCFICGQKAEHTHPYAHWQEIQPDGSRGCPIWGGKGPKDPAKTIFAQAALMNEVERKRYSIDMPTLKTHLARVLARTAPDLRYPDWIEEISDEWNIVFVFDNDIPQKSFGFVPNYPRPQTTYREMTRLDDFTSLYLEYDARIYAVIESIKEIDPQQLIECDEVEVWPADLQAIYDAPSDAEYVVHKTWTMEPMLFFLVWERAMGSTVGDSWTRHVPRGLRFSHWKVDRDPLAPANPPPHTPVTFASLQFKKAPQLQQVEKSALIQIELLLLNSPLFSLVINLLDDVDKKPYLLPPPPPGQRTIEFYHATIPLKDSLLFVAHYANNAENDPKRNPTPLPEWWNHPDLPTASQLVIKYVRDGQASDSFEKASIAGAFLKSTRTNQRAMERLTQSCCFVTEMEKSERLLQGTLVERDVGIFGEILTEQEFHQKDLSAYKVFDGQAFS